MYDALRYFAALALVLGLIIVAYYLAKQLLTRGQFSGQLQSWGRKRAGAAERLLDIRETLALDPKRRLVRIGYGDSELLILLGPHNDQLLNRKRPPRGPHSQQDAEGDFPNQQTDPQAAAEFKALLDGDKPKKSAAKAKKAGA